MSELTLTAGGDQSTREYQQPPLGEVKAVLVDVILSKDQPTKFGVKDQVFLYFELEHLMDDNRPFLIRKKFNFSLNEKSNLYKFIQKWVGGLKPGKPFNLETLKGKGCILEIEPWTPEGEPDKTLHLIDRARKLDEAKWIKPSGEFDSAKTAERIEEKRKETVADNPYPADDDDVPF
jgi:hypothetical protein